MKKLILLGFNSILLVACSTPVQQSTVPMDMQAVYDYQQRVITKQTVEQHTKQNDEPLNQSDQRSKSTSPTIYPVIYPNIGVGYHHGWGRYRYSF